MPLSNYFKGHGDEVMEDMQKRYGAKKGKSVFYATANKRKNADAQAKALKGKSKEGEK